MTEVQPKIIPCQAGFSELTNVIDQFLQRLPNDRWTSWTLLMSLISLATLRRLAFRLLVIVAFAVCGRVRRVQSPLQHFASCSQRDVSLRHSLTENR